MNNTGIGKVTKLNYEIGYGFIDSKKFGRIFVSINTEFSNTCFEKMKLNDKVRVTVEDTPRGKFAKVVSVIPSGFTLLEVLISTAIIGGLLYGLNTALIMAIKQSKVITTRLDGATNRAIAARTTGDKRVYFATTSVCMPIIGNFYAKKSSTTLSVYTTANCTGSIVKSISTYSVYDDVDNSALWVFATEGSDVHLVVRKLNF